MTVCCLMAGTAPWELPGCPFLKHVPLNMDWTQVITQETDVEFGLERHRPKWEQVIRGCADHGHLRVSLSKSLSNQTTLPPIIMEVDNVLMEYNFPLGCIHGNYVHQNSCRHSPLSWLLLSLCGSKMHNIYIYMYIYIERSLSTEKGHDRPAGCETLLFSNIISPSPAEKRAPLHPKRSTRKKKA